MSDLGQQGLFDITRTLLQQPDLASLCEALSQLVKRSALADNAAIVLWQAQTQRALDYASREKDTPIKYEKTKLFWHTVRYAAFCRALIRCIAVTKNFVEPGRSWPQVGYTQNLVTIA
ncbi:formate hydrogenlyase [Escherichia coli]